MEKIKCVVWDLDNTLWNGVLLEDESVLLREGVKDTIVELDNRGILQSIASKNNFEDAWAKLKELDVEKYFLYPQIHWGKKSDSISLIAKEINIGIDTIAFIDDQEFERDEVNFSCPMVRCYSSENVKRLLDCSDFMPNFITCDSTKRREMYFNEICRNKDEALFDGSSEEFLYSLKMELSITNATKTDLQRVEELMVRTHQLNSTGYVYDYETLCNLIDSEKYALYVIGLKDKYGDYGKIGIVLLELQDKIWIIRLFLLSCRVMSKGIGGSVLQYIAQMAENLHYELTAEFIHNGKNRMLYLTFLLNGFVEEKIDGKTILKYKNSKQQKALPGYIFKLHT